MTKPVANERRELVNWVRYKTVKGNTNQGTKKNAYTNVQIAENNGQSSVGGKDTDPGHRAIMGGEREHARARESTSQNQTSRSFSWASSTKPPGCSLDIWNLQLYIGFLHTLNSLPP